MWTNDDVYFMKMAIDKADEAARCGEVPVGAVIVIDNQVISTGYNCPIISSDPTAHAEIVALRNASMWLCNYRVSNAIMYVTLEPCIMCFGALIQARVRRVIFGTRDMKIMMSDWIDSINNINHRLECYSGLLENECREQLTTFFHRRRL